MKPKIIRSAVILANVACGILALLRLLSTETHRSVFPIAVANTHLSSRYAMLAPDEESSIIPIDLDTFGSSDQYLFNRAMEDHAVQFSGVVGTISLNQNIDTTWSSMISKEGRSYLISAANISLRGLHSDQTVVCNFSPHTQEQLHRVRAGQTITVIGRYYGSAGGPMYMMDCTIAPDDRFSAGVQAHLPNWGDSTLLP